ncbi:uncharacterized protein LOC110439066 [Tachysurus ichikawai]
MDTQMPVLYGLFHDNGYTKVSELQHTVHRILCCSRWVSIVFMKHQPSLNLSMQREGSTLPFCNPQMDILHAQPIMRRYLKMCITHVLRHLKATRKGAETGRDIIRAHKAHKQVNGPPNAPFAQKLDLAWVIIGDMCPGKVHKPTFIQNYHTNIMENEYDRDDNIELPPPLGCSSSSPSSSSSGDTCPSSSAQGKHGKRKRDSTSEMVQYFERAEERFFQQSKKLDNALLRETTADTHSLLGLMECMVNAIVK